jgi:glycosyltransferase involved in cell wall biosynthesis
MADAASLTLLNPHADDFVSTPVSFWLVGRRGLGKYKYLLDEPIRRGRRPSILVDGTLSSLVDQSLFARLPYWLRAVILRFEIFFWLRHNGLTDRVDVHWSLDTIRDRTAIYVFSYKNCVGAFDRRQAVIASFDHAIVNLSHYFIRTREKADNIAKLPNARLHTDSDLSRNAYFQNFFPKPPPMIVLPFAVSGRFAVKQAIAERSAKCAATGSFHNLQDEEPRAYYRDFITFFRTDTYHPVRKLLYQRRAEIADWLECRISPYREMEGKNRLGSRVRKMLGLDVVQADYFSFDIVDFYNHHRFAIVGEELSGAPAVGFFEAMACGCVVLGANGGYYDGLGLEPGVHYLEHDGSIESIRAAMTHIAAKPEQMVAMTHASRLYIKTHCTPQAVWDRLQANLDRSGGRSGP